MIESKVQFSVIKVSQPLGDFFIGSINAIDLLAISYADVRRIGERDVEKYLGIQRPLDRGRVKKIRQYLKSPDATFPTGIVLAVDDNCAEHDDLNHVLTLKPFISDIDDDESVPLNKIAKILDGQHRIDAFNDDDGNVDHQFIVGENLTNFQFNVVVFVGLDIDEQANIFATVNLAQTKVNKSIVYDLEGLSKTRSPFRTCHFIAVALDSANEKSPLYKRIKRLGVKTKGRALSEPLTQAGFVESLIKLLSPDPFQDRIELMKGKTPKLADNAMLKKHPFRNLFLEELDNSIALNVYNYFDAVRVKWPNAWSAIDKQGNILPRSNAFKALVRYLKVAYLQIVGPEIGRVVSAEEFSKTFIHIDATDDDFTTGNFKPGSGGESAFYKLLTGEKTIADLKETPT